MTGQTVSLPTPDGAMPAHDALPPDDARGGVIVVQEAFGVTAHIEDVANRFAAAGYRALAPHFFHRGGSPIFAHDDITGAMGGVNVLTGASIRADVDAALAYFGAAGLPPERCAIVGFCMGGSISCFAAAEYPLGAAVTFYGGGVTESRWKGVPPLAELGPRLRTPWLGLYGDQDGGIPIDQVEALRSAAAQASVPTEVQRYAEAGHAFHNDARPDRHHAESASDAWQRTLAFLEAHI